MKEVRKHILDKKEYYLNVANNCVHLSGHLELTLPEVSLITNVTTNTIIYNPHCEGMGGTLVKGKIIFEKPLTSDMDDRDDLMFILQQNVLMEGQKGDSTKVIEENSHVLKDILKELRINNHLLTEAFNIDATFGDRDLDTFN